MEDELPPFPPHFQLSQNSSPAPKATLYLRNCSEGSKPLLDASHALQQRCPSLKGREGEGARSNSLSSSRRSSMRESALFIQTIRCQLVFISLLPFSILTADMVKEGGMWVKANSALLLTSSNSADLIFISLIPGSLSLSFVSPSNHQQSSSRYSSMLPSIYRARTTSGPISPCGHPVPRSPLLRSSFLASPPSPLLWIGARGEFGRTCFHSPNHHHRISLSS